MKYLLYVKTQHFRVDWFRDEDL